MDENTLFIAYPKGIVRAFFRAPLWLYRLGWGDLLRGTNLMVLTTRGRKSGLARHTVVEYARHGSKLYVISAWGLQPDWVQNVRAHPTVTVQIGSSARAATATLLSDPSEITRALLMFRKRSALHEYVLERLSATPDITPRVLKEISSHFTVVRFDLADVDTPPPLAGVAATHRVWGWAMVTGAVVSVLVLLAGALARQGKPST